MFNRGISAGYLAICVFMEIVSFIALLNVGPQWFVLLAIAVFGYYTYRNAVDAFGTAPSRPGRAR